MQYLLVIYNNDETSRDFMGPGRAEFDAAHAAVYTELRDRGELISTNALDQADAKIVRAPGGAPIVTDGPYAETREFVGGFYLIDVADEARALEIAGRLHEARTSQIEVRRVIVGAEEITRQPLSGTVA